MSTKSEATDDKEPPAQTNEPALGLACVKALLERHGVARHKQAPTIAEALDKSAPHAYRLLKGESPWSLELLERLGKHFGEELGDVVSFGMPDTSMPGLLAFEQTRVPCRVWLDENAQDAPAGALVADRVGGEWIVGVHKQRGRLRGKLVRRMVVQPPAAIWRVAVLDDRSITADSLAIALNEAGFDAAAFYGEDSLRKAIAQAPFDAYLIDWILGDDSARALVAWIREKDAGCPIGVMTGEIETGRVVETELRDAVKEYGLHFVIDKPYRPMLVAAQLTQAFAAK